MTLSADGYNRLEYLLGKQRAQGLAPDEQSELRDLVGQENPGAVNENMDALVKLGLIIVGAYFLVKLLSKE